MTERDIRPPTRAELQAKPPAPLQTGRNWTKADVFLWGDAAARLAVKDYAAQPGWVRNSIGRFLLRRECAAYERLRGIEGIPPLAGRIDAHALAVGFVEGKDLSRFRRTEVPAEFFDRLLGLLDAVHRAGVAHGDLHHRDVLVGPGGVPYLVDFSTAVVSGDRPGWLRRRLFAAACASDRRAALKLKRRHAPASLTVEEARDLDTLPLWYRAGKALRRLVGGSRN